jgi:hypothetical protein
MGVPHPLGYFNLAKVISSNWTEIDKAIGKGNPKYLAISQIVPESSDDARLVAISNRYEKRLVDTSKSKRVDPKTKIAS